MKETQTPPQLSEEEQNLAALEERFKYFIQNQQVPFDEFLRLIEEGQINIPEME